ncbi:phage major capsid protein [Falsihalocynthiibacter arcticus]|uniref:phage major capsid protein n=1 Tax=Falsihalocynthiibacter arcticus TaxID=1579316 RepID=UPI003001F65C
MLKKRMMPFVALAALASGMPSAVISAPRNDAGAVDQLLKDVRQELATVSDGVKKVAETALAQSQKTGEVSAETKIVADKALAQFHGLSTAQAALMGKLEALETRNLDLEQSFAAGGGGGSGAPMSLGREIAGGDALKNWLGAGAQGGLTLRPENAITTAGGSGGGVIWGTEDRDPANIAMQKISIRSLLTMATTESDVVKFSKQTTRTNNASAVAEGGTPVESVLGWTKAEANVRKLVAFVHASDEALADGGQLQSLIDQELRYMLDIEEEEQILAGDGTGENLSGLITEATAFSASSGLPNATPIDRLRLGILQLALSNYAANGVTLNPIDWAGIELVKDTTNRYIFGNPNEQTTPRLWGLDVVPTLSHSAGEWMAGNFKLAATLYDRQQTEVLISSEHGTNFVDGLKTIKGSKRLAMAVKRSAALVTGNFTFA